LQLYFGHRTQKGQAMAQPAERRQRADAKRNHDALLDAAGEAFAERGSEVSLEDIAKRAGVGIGTLYRHFPTRDALNEAVYRNEVETLCDTVGPLLAAHPADEALRAWMHGFAAYVAKKRGMAAALKSALGADNELFTYSRQRLTDAIVTLVTTAADAGVIRSDTDPEDVLKMLSGICMASDVHGAQSTDRLIDLIMDGLRFGAPRATAPV
jgi:AcrR family transcriptional regulator